MPRAAPPPAVPPTNAAPLPAAVAQVPPVIALVGEDSFLQVEALSRITAALPRGIDRIDLDGERCQLADVLDELRSFAMFGSGKLVVVRNGEELISRFRSQLEDFLASPPTDSTLVLRVASLPANQRIYKAIAKAGRVEQCAPPKNHELARWIINRAKAAQQVTVTPAAADLLADLVGADLGRLDNEIAKLALQLDGNTIDVADIGQTVAFQREQEMWSLTDALTSGKSAEALRRWRQLVRMDSSSEFRAVTWLAIWLANLRKAIALRRKRVPDAVIAKSCRIFDPRLQAPFFRTVERLGDEGVNQAVNLLADIDRRIKSGVGDAASSVERFIMSIA